MDLTEYYKVLARQAKPDVSDEDLSSQLNGVDNEKLKSALGPLLPAELPDSLPMKDPNTVGSSYDVASSNAPVTANGGGLNPKMSQQEMDSSGITNPPAEIPFGQQTPPADPLPPMPPEPPMPSGGQITPPVAPLDENTPDSESNLGNKGKGAPSPLSSLVADPSSSDSQDAEKRKALDDKNAMLKKVGALSSLGAGIGDAIGNAAIPYGGKGASGTQDKVMANTKDQIATNKEEFETKLKQDPTSDVSKSYRQMVLQIAPDLAKNTNFQNMSAQAIGDKLPLIDTMMKARAQEDAKKLGMEQLKATRDLSQNASAEKNKDYRFKQLGEALDPSKQRSGAFGVSKQKFDRAEALESLASAYPDGNLDSRQIEEMAIGLNSMLSGANTGAQQQVAALVPHSIMGNAQKMTEWLTNNPRGAQQQAFVQRLTGTIQREKATAEDQMNRTRFSRLAPYQDLEKQDPGMFSDVLQSQGVDPAKWKEWKQNGFKPISAVQSPEALAVPTVASQQDYERLPSGASYKDANGKTYRKK